MEQFGSVPMADGKARKELGISSDGKRRPIVVYGRTAQEARAKLNAADPTLRSHEVSRITVAEYFESWLEDVSLTSAPAAYKLRRTYVRYHILPLIGGIRFQSLTNGHVRQVIRRRERDGIRPNALLNIYNVKYFLQCCGKARDFLEGSCQRLSKAANIAS
jgi:hypothetical protein